MKTSLFFLIGISVIVLTSCTKSSKSSNKVDSRHASKTGDWIVIGRSGGVITDVYKLEGALVQSEYNFDGWYFEDRAGNMVNISGDCKVISVDEKKQEIFGKYIEYHMEFDSLTYQQRLKSFKK
jgi:hypothetical protein